MKPRCLSLAVVFLLAPCSLAYPQSTPGPAEPLLGEGHIWLKAGKIELDEPAAGAWGMDREGYLALEGYHVSGNELYVGGELGRVTAGGQVDEQGDTIRDVGFWWLEFNGKKAFDLKRGLSIDLGLGVALFYIDGEEVSSAGGISYTDPLADLGFGTQVFADFSWRTRRFLIGLNAKYQWAFDAIEISYSNLRIGAHAGFCF